MFSLILEQYEAMAEEAEEDLANMDSDYDDECAGSECEDDDDHMSEECARSTCEDDEDLMDDSETDDELDTFGDM